MECTYAFGGFIASLLGFIWIYRLKNSRKVSTSVKDQSGASKRSTNGILRSDTDGSTDVIIVGAGVAGSALAYALGKDGWRVHLIERDLTGPDRMAGELLQPGGFLKLIELGLEDCVKGIDAQQVFGVVFHKDERIVNLPFPLEHFPPDVTAYCFHNGRFIQNLRQRATSLSNVRLEQGTVKSLIKEKGTVKGVCFKSKMGEEMTAYAPLTIVSDGCFSNLRRSLSNPKVGSTARLVGLVLENSCNDAVARAVLTDTPMFSYPVGSNKTRMMVDISDKNMPSISNGAMAKYLRTDVAPLVPKELRDAFVSAVDKGDLKVATCQSMPASPCPTPGGFLIGDALNIRHPFSAGGMTVALSDAIMLRDLLRPLKNLGDPVAVCKHLEPFYLLRKPMAYSINTMGALLPKVLLAPEDPLIKELGDAFFDYLCLGAIFRSGLISVFAALYPSPSSLAVQFVAMGVFSVGRLLLPFPSPKRLLKAARLLKSAASTIFPIIKEGGIRDTFFPWTLPAYYRRVHQT